VSEARLTALVSGRVQGVGFRYWVRQQAGELGLRGSATNLRDGRVEVVVEGPRAECANLLARLRGDRTPGAVLDVFEQWDEPRGETGFRVG
jgi:acylphosphatase